MPLLAYYVLGRPALPPSLFDRQSICIKIIEFNATQSVVARKNSYNGDGRTQKFLMHDDSVRYNQAQSNSDRL